MIAIEVVYVVRCGAGDYVADITGQYRIADRHGAYQFLTRAEARAVCSRSSDMVYEREIVREW